MNDASSQTASQSVGFGPEGVFDHLLEMQEGAFGSFSQMSPVWMKTMSALSAEVLKFASERLGEDLQAQQDFLACRAPAEFRETQGRFLKTAFDQYCAQCSRLCRLQHAALHELAGGFIGR